MLPNQNVPETNCLPEWLSALEGQPTAWLIRLYAKPGAKKNQIVGEFAGSLKIAIHAPPEEGQSQPRLVGLSRPNIGFAQARFNRLTRRNQPP
jgi:uncharacterized protein YggU (UPF0235/DUF167 family)